MKRILTVLLFTGCISCGESTNHDTQKDSTSTTDKKVVEEGLQSETNTSEACYMQILKRDTMVLHLFSKGNELSGKLNFDNYEKDGSSGPVKGTRNGNIIKLIYTFNSEGMTSVAEEYFKISGNDLERGVGDIANKGDTTYFTSTNNIQYNGGRFMRIDCAQIPMKYKR